MKQNQPTDVQSIRVYRCRLSARRQRYKEGRKGSHVIEESRAHGLVLARDPLRPASRIPAHRLARFDLWVCVFPRSDTSI